MNLNLDPRTIMFINFISTFIMGSGLLIVSRGYLAQIKEIRTWAFATLIQATAWLLIDFRNYIPDLFSILFASILLLISLSIYFTVMCKFAQVKIKSYLIIFPLIIASLAIYYFTYIVPNFGNRVITMSVYTMLFMFSSSIVISYKKVYNKTHFLTGVIFTICGLIMLFHSIYTLQSSTQVKDSPIANSHINVIMNLTYFITSLILTLCFLLMCNDRYISIQKYTETILINDKDVLEASYQTALIGSWEIKDNNKSVFLSKMSKSILELSNDSTINLDTLIQFYKTENKEQTAEFIHKFLKQPDTSFDIKLQVNTAKDNNRWIRIIGKSEFDDNGGFRLFGVLQDITTEVKLKAEINFVEDRFKNAFESSAIGIALMDLDEKLIVVNKQICNILGFEKEEFDKLTFNDITHPDDLKMDLIFINQLKQGCIKCYNREKRYFHKNGNIIWIFLTVSAIKDNDNNVIQFIAHIIDIDKRKKNESELKQSQQEYKSLFEQNPDGVYSLDINGEFISVNDSLLKMVGCTKEEFLQINFLQLSIPPNSEVLKYHFKESLKGIPQNYNARFANIKGDKIHVNITNMPIIVDGTVIGIYGIVKNITEQINNSEILEKNERRLKEAQKIAKIGNYSYDFKNANWICSEIVNEISGLTAEEIRDLNIWKTLIAPEFEEQFFNKFHEIKERGKNISNNNQDYKIIRPNDKEERWISINVEIEYDATGKPSLLFGTVQDITERKIDEIKLLQSYDDIRLLTNHLQSIREEERINIAREIHDELGQQLSILRMDIMTLINKSDSPSPIFYTKTKQMIRLVDNSIQTIKKISLELRPSILDNLGLIAALDWQATEFQDRTGIICDFETTCLSDNFSKEINTAVFRIFQESLTNIIRHANATEVKTKLYKVNNTIILEVSDNGIGIGSTNVRKKTSFGILGMKERVAMLNGDISILNASKHGTDVKLKIPLQC